MLLGCVMCDVRGCCDSDVRGLLGVMYDVWCCEVMCEECSWGEVRCMICDKCCWVGCHI